MENTKMNTVAAAIEKFSVTVEMLPLESEQAWTSSGYYMATYLKEHADTDACFGADEASLFAAGRLDGLLRQTRPTLSGIFSENNIIALIDCYQGDLFSPDKMNNIASDLCDHLGVKVDSYETSGIASLIDTLLELSPVQRVTLADALEQTWYRGMKQMNKSPKEFFSILGIELT